MSPGQHLLWLVNVNGHAGVKGMTCLDLAVHQVSMKLFPQCDCTSWTWRTGSDWSLTGHHRWSEVASHSSRLHWNSVLVMCLHSKLCFNCIMCMIWLWRLCRCISFCLLCCVVPQEDLEAGCWSFFFFLKESYMLRSLPKMYQVLNSEIKD